MCDLYCVEGARRLNVMQFTFQITNHLIRSLFNGCMTLSEFIALYISLLISVAIYFITYRPAKNILSSNCIAILIVNISR